MLVHKTTSTPGRNNAGNLKKCDILKISNTKLSDMGVDDIAKATKIIEGTARSMVGSRILARNFISSNLRIKRETMFPATFSSFYQGSELTNYSLELGFKLLYVQEVVTHFI